MSTPIANRIKATTCAKQDRGDVNAVMAFAVNKTHEYNIILTLVACNDAGGGGGG